MVDSLLKIREKVWLGSGLGRVKGDEFNLLGVKYLWAYPRGSVLSEQKCFVGYAHLEPRVLPGQEV